MSVAGRRSAPGTGSRRPVVITTHEGSVEYSRLLYIGLGGIYEERYLPKFEIHKTFFSHAIWVNWTELTQIE